MVATGQEMDRGKNSSRSGKVREFHFKLGKIENIFGRSQGEVNILFILFPLPYTVNCF